MMLRKRRKIKVFKGKQMTFFKVSLGKMQTMQ